MDSISISCINLSDLSTLLMHLQGSTAILSSYGASLVSLSVPNKKGVFENVIRGFGTPQESHANAHGLNNGPQKPLYVLSSLIP